MRFISLAACVYATAVLQVWLGPKWQIHAATPDLLALVAFGWFTTTPASRGLLVVALVGLASDLTAGSPLGVAVGCYAAVGYWLIRLHTWIRLDRLPARLASIWAAASLSALVQSTVERLSGHGALGWHTVFDAGALTGLYTLGISLPALTVIGWIREASAPHVMRMVETT